MKLAVLPQISSGLIVGLSAIIYAVSYAALMFNGSLSGYVAYGMGMAIVAAMIGGLYGVFAEDPTLVSGPDSNTSSVLAGMVTVLAAVNVSAPHPEHDALLMILMASVLTAVIYLAIDRFNLARFVRFVPFQVMAGFLAATGWMMCSGALNIIAQTPLNAKGIALFLAHPFNPALIVGVALAIMLVFLNKRFKPAIVVPLFMVVVTIAAYLLLPLLCTSECKQPNCNLTDWYFQSFDKVKWAFPWELRPSQAFWDALPGLIPSMLAVSFVATLTVLLSLSSLELDYRRDFGLSRALRLHGGLTLLAAGLGGYLGIISIARSNMCKQTGGGKITGFVIALSCFAVLMGLGWVIAAVPKVAVGALVLYLGIGMLQQWVWNLRKAMNRLDFAQVLTILVSIILFGYVVGFLVGVVISCIVFVVNYSSMSQARLNTTLQTVRSSVVRSRDDQDHLSAEGQYCRIAQFEGFVFFGVAQAIYDWYRHSGEVEYKVRVLDFAQVRDIDRSAISVIEKIIRAQEQSESLLVISAGPSLTDAMPVLLKYPGAWTKEDIALRGIRVLPVFDEALECAEQALLSLKPVPEHAMSNVDQALSFVLSSADRGILARYFAEQALAPGDVLFEEGQQSDSLYLVETGSLEIVLNTGGKRLRLAKITAGSMVGEMAFFSGQPRTASVLAVENSAVLGLTRQSWDALCKEFPGLAAVLSRQVILNLSSALSRTNSRFVAAGSLSQRTASSGPAAKA